MTLADLTARFFRRTAPTPAALDDAPTALLRLRPPTGHARVAPPEPRRVGRHRAPEADPPAPEYTQPAPPPRGHWASPADQHWTAATHADHELVRGHVRGLHRRSTPAGR